jgi:hypothetical protein
MYIELFDTYLPTHKIVGKSALSGNCDSCKLEVTLETSDNSFKFVDAFTKSELCFKKDTFRDLADGTRHWKSIVNRFESGATQKALSKVSTPEHIAMIEKRSRKVADHSQDLLFAYIDLYSQTPKFDEEVVENILSPISLV